MDDAPHTRSPIVEGDEGEGENGQHTGAGRTAVEALAGAHGDEAQKGASASPDAIIDATEWFLASEEDVEEVSTLSFGLNVAGAGKPRRIVRWTVQALDRDRIRAIRRMNTKTQGGNEVEDEMAVNLRVAAEGTIDPPLRDAHIRGKFLDPADALRGRLKHKPGLIDLIANRVMTCSGYDQGDVVELEAGKGS